MFNNKLIFACMAGSHLYGLNRPDSDVDIRGVCFETLEQMLGNRHKFEQYVPGKVESLQWSGDNLSVEAEDVQIYGISKFFQLCIDANPNIIELLFAEPIYTSDEWTRIRNNRHWFLSNKIIHTFSGYAYSQLARIKGHKRWIDNPPTKPIPEEYGMVLTDKGGQKWTDSNKYNQYQSLIKDYNSYETWKAERNPKRQELEVKYGYDCYSEDTEFLTNNGWKQYHNIDANDLLATINNIELNIEYQKFFDRVKKRYTGIMYNVKSIDTNCLVTPNHRMFVSESHRGKIKPFNDSFNFIRLCDIIRSNKSRYNIVTIPENNNQEYSIEDWYLELIGAYVSDGTSSFRNNKLYCIRMSQTIKGKQEFSDMMDRIGKEYIKISKYSYQRINRGYNEYVWIIYGDVAKRIHSDCGHLSKEKRLPRWIINLSKRQARLLLKALILGDGTVRKTSYIYYTNNQNLANDIQELCLIAGYNSSIYKSKTNGMYLVGIRHYKSRKTNTVILNNKLDEVYYDGNIVCFSVPNESLITRRNGKISIQGNTKHAMHIFRLFMEANELLLTGELTLPLREDDKSILLDVYNGKIPYDDLVKYAEGITDNLKNLEVVSVLPKQPDFDKVENMLIDIKMEYLLSEELDGI